MGRVQSMINKCPMKKRMTEQGAVSVAIIKGHPYVPYKCRGEHWHVGKRRECGWHNIDFRQADPYEARERYLERQRAKVFTQDEHGVWTVNI